MSTDKEIALFEYLLALGDTSLVHGQRISEWCGHGPFLEEDIALANTALDLIGRARLLLNYAGEVEGRGRSEDDLAYQRDERDWRNLLIAELPKGDFAFTSSRQFLLDALDYHLYSALCDCTDPVLNAIAHKAVKECEYHLRHSGEWMRRLGDGTEQSHVRTQQAVNELWPYVSEMFATDNHHELLVREGIAADMDAVRGQWDLTVNRVLEQATLARPADSDCPYRGGRAGLHTEHMGFLLAELQFVQRAYPGMQW